VSGYDDERYDDESVKQYDDEKETSRSWFQREVSQA
tara:strand:- start:12488 stop:12595 length:108 start_codon:yes stop_codon:yes gene_type:complete